MTALPWLVGGPQGWTPELLLVLVGVLGVAGLVAFGGWWALR